ncbi:MAG: arginine deiminase family protein [Thermoplasmata archaeon]
MTVRRAIVREPGARYSECISSHPLKATIDIARAREQHAAYCRVLEDLGLEVIRLERDDHHPDSCFVEDNAVVFRDRALITRMAKPSRRGEERDVERVLGTYLRTRRAVPPATVEGGDVIHLEERLISGLSQRTNEPGIAQMREWLGAEVGVIADESMVHLKSHVNYIGEGTFVAVKRYANHPQLRGAQVLVVPDEEAYAANALAIGDAVLTPRGFPRTFELLKGTGMRVIPLEMTEFPKCEGALTCLSILF